MIGGMAGAIFAVVLAMLAAVVAVLRRRLRAKAAVLRDYVTVVLPRLEALYGQLHEYEPVQVDRAMEETGVSRRFRVHAYALFCSRADFVNHPACARRDYDKLNAKMLLVHRRYVERPWGGGKMIGSVL